MTALPLSNSLAKVKKLLPVRIRERLAADFIIEDKNGGVFCRVPHTRNDALARALLIRDAMNQMKKDEA